eukprot:scaffold325569_cov58-Tisochrysis_lutea.AAC.1
MQVASRSLGTSHRRCVPTLPLRPLATCLDTRKGATAQRAILHAASYSAIVPTAQCHCIDLS